MTDTITRLRHAITTASNDDTSLPDTTLRRRHGERIAAMGDAVGEIERLRLAALEIAADRLATGFMRYLQTDNKCAVTGRACHDKCGCREELKEWCRQ